MKTFLTSDLHFKHRNILSYCDRPYANVKEMEDGLIKNWNSVVGPNDLVYDLGDVCFHGEKNKDFYISLNERLNGRHVLILGNHDPMKAMKYVECGFESVHTSLIVDNILLIHDPVAANCVDKDMMVFCGHVHNIFKKLSKPWKILNVGCDVWNYTPVEWNIALQYLKYAVPDPGVTLDMADMTRTEGIRKRREERKKNVETS